MFRIRFAIFLLIPFLHFSLTLAPSLRGQDAESIPPQEIEELEAKLAESEESGSNARKKLALKRVIRSAEALLKANEKASNRYEALGVIFRGQQALIQIEDSATHRRDFLKTCAELASAPKEYAAIRLDADLLLSQAELAKRGASPEERAEALIPLVKRYQDTEVEAKVIRVAMLMALEFGDARLIGYLRQVIAERFPGDPEMINFQRDKLAGQVFGAPFIGQFEQTNGKLWSFPTDCLGLTTGLYFWSKENGGLEDLQELAAAWKKVPPEDQVRYRFVSFNLDELPDSGESTLRELGLDWPALKLPGGKDHPIYKTYARRDPSIITVSPTGYAAIFISGGRSSRGYERNLQSMLARVWTKSRYTQQLQSIFSGEWMVVDALGEFDSTRPPELKAVADQGEGEAITLKPTSNAVPPATLTEIQACFLRPPVRYRANVDLVRAGFKRADALCKNAIEKYPEAENLWIVRNRRIIALLGLWQIDHEHADLEAAVTEARSALESDYPSGTDVVPRFCLAKQALRSGTEDPSVVIPELVQHFEGPEAFGPALGAAALLALDVGDRRLHEQYRAVILVQQAEHPMMCTVVSFMLNRYQRYWLYHPPFVAGWTYGRRQGHFLSIGEPEQSQRSIAFELEPLEGARLRVPEDISGRWTIIEFVSTAEGARHMQRYGSFIEKRPFDDVQIYAAVIGEDLQATRAKVEAKEKPDPFPTFVLPEGIDNPVVNFLGILDEDQRPNLLILRPDGSIAAAVSGLTMQYQKENVVQNVIEWHDERLVDLALQQGDIEEAKRLAFAFVPPVDPSADETKKPASSPVVVPHLRSRAKVYMAMEDWESAFEDIQAVYLQVNSKAGWLSMRTEELAKTEALKVEIESHLDTK